jgi:hypothetical protein
MMAMVARAATARVLLVVTVSWADTVGRCGRPWSTSARVTALSMCRSPTWRNPVSSCPAWRNSLVSGEISPDQVKNGG